jgi:hypothetical protein
MKELLDALRKTAAFLLRDYLERKRLKRESYVSTMQRFEHEAKIREATTAAVEELTQGIEEAESLLSQLQS